MTLESTQLIYSCVALTLHLFIVFIYWQLMIACCALTRIGWRCFFFLGDWKDAVDKFFFIAIKRMEKKKEFLRLDDWTTVPSTK